MNEIINAFGSITVERLLVYIFAIFFIIKYARLGYQKITDFHDKEQEKESIRNLVKENSKQIKELKELFEHNIEEDRKYKLRSLADKIFVCYNSSKMQGFITPRQLENFLANVEEYKTRGGNGVVEKKYLPEVLAMEVKEFDAEVLSRLAHQIKEETNEE